MATINGTAGNVNFTHNNDGYVFNTAVNGAIDIINSGNVKTVMTANSLSTGKVKILDGTLQFGTGGITGAFYGDIENDGRLIINRSLLTRYEGSISGSGINDHDGTDTLTMTGNSSTFTGTSNVNNGTVFMNGVLGGTTNVKDGAFLGGLGTIGTVFVETGGTLLGQQGDIFTIDGDLNFAPGSFIGAGLGQQSTTGLFNVSGNVVLDGAINVRDQGGYGPGLYRIINYGGTLTNNVLEVGTLPAGVDRNQVQVQLLPGQVNLINTGDLQLNFWDGPSNPQDNVVNGGNGVWENAESRWTLFDGSLNARWDKTFAIFQGAAGTVDVSHAVGAIQAQGMQFAVDGYLVKGDSIELTAAESIIRVGDGTGSENITATVASALTGNATLSKTDRGTLILDGENTYTGGTNIRRGVLQVSSDANLGHADGDVMIEGARLRNTKAFTTARDFAMGTGGGVFETRENLTITGLVSGAESLTKTGAANLILTKDNTYGEGTLIEQGGIHLGDGGTSGWIQGDVSNYGELVFNRSDAKSFDGVISGAGRIVQQGSGMTTLTADSLGLTGDSEVRAGTLSVNGKLGGTMAVNSGRLQGIGSVGATTLAAAGTIAPGNSIGNLTITGDFVGNGGLIEIESELGTDSSPTDLLTIMGSSSGNARVQVINVGGQGGVTVEGIKIIDVGGTSDGVFTLQGDYTFQGDQAVVAGAYSYRLYKGGASTPTDGDWYLRSTLTSPIDPPIDPPVEPPVNPPKPPLYQPGVPLYEVYPHALQTLNRMGTLQQRVGNRSWSDAQGAYGTNGVDSRGVWARLDAGHLKVNPRASTTDSTFTQNYYRLQMGVDTVVGENENGTVVAGVNVIAQNAKAKVSSEFGNGTISTDGFGVGGTVTWYGNSGMYVDGQAQVNWFRSNLNSDLVANRLVHRNDATGYGVSIEAGKRIELNDTWTLTPQGQLTYSNVSVDTFSDTFDARVNVNRNNSTLGRLGVAASRDKSWAGDDGKMSRSHFYGIANLKHEFSNAPRVRVSDTPVQLRQGRSSAELGLGGTYSWANDAYSVYGEASAASNFHNFGKSYDIQGQIGFRFRW